MASVKTSQNDTSVEEFLDSVQNDQRKKDGWYLYELLRNITGESPKMWGPSIIGYGSYHYKYESGREGDWFLAGFSPRKQGMTIYIMMGFGRYEKLLAQLGKHKLGKSCLYINKLSDVDQEVLKELIQSSYHHMNKKYNQG